MIVYDTGNVKWESELGYHLLLDHGSSLAYMMFSLANKVCSVHDVAIYELAL